MPTTLYHYTDRDYHLPKILAAGHLKVTESNISLKPGQVHAGPDVVWLTTDPELTPDRIVSRDGLYAGLNLIKLEVRFTVRLPSASAKPWRAWALRHGASPVAVKELINSAGGGWRRWRVVERPIPRSEWVDVIDTVTGERLAYHGPASERVDS